jgi:hypothetical protein
LEKVQALLFFLSALNAAIERAQTQTRLQYAEREQGRDFNHKGTNFA